MLKGKLPEITKYIMYLHLYLLYLPGKPIIKHITSVLAELIGLMLMMAFFNDDDDNQKMMTMNEWVCCETVSTHTMLVWTCLAYPLMTRKTRILFFKYKILLLELKSTKKGTKIVCWTLHGSYVSVQRKCQMCVATAQQKSTRHILRV